jgi:hypothetical protein
VSKQSTGMVAVQLSEPSEYPAKGEAQWNIYPFVRTAGGEIQLGSISEYLYTINAAEARGVAAALLAAAARITAEVAP